MKTFLQISLMAAPWRKAATQTFVVSLFHLTLVSSKAIAVSLSLIQLSFFFSPLILAHPHIQGGRSDDRLPIVNHPCSARRTIYIPIDTSLRFALIVHKNVPHNHPMPRIDKASFDTKATYQKCVEAAGVLGATVQKVDQGQFNLLCLFKLTEPLVYNSFFNVNLT
jgi:hypothetical protein